MLCAATLNGNDLSSGTCISSLVLFLSFFSFSFFFFGAIDFFFGLGEEGGPGFKRERETSGRFIAPSYMALLCLGGRGTDKVSFSSWIFSFFLLLVLSVRFELFQFLCFFFFFFFFVKLATVLNRPCIHVCV